jgi:hypothetical protein
MRTLSIAMSLVLLVACSSDPDADGTSGLTLGPTGSTSDSTDSASTGSDDFAPFVVRCDPSAEDACATFGDVACCSDDPTAILLSPENLDDAVTPLYQGRGGEGTPVFSGGNNPLSRWGYCLVEETAPTLALFDVNAEGCRAPCNPTWSANDITAVCGASALCCQTVELEPEDCVLDPNLGDAGCFRPVNGTDIMGLGTTNLTNWASTSHATHQDPSGLNCGTFANGLPPDLGIDPNDVLTACFRRLTVADQRGSCFALSELASCPYAAPNYVDACEQQNADNQLTGCD